MFKLPDIVSIALLMLREAGFESHIVGGCIRDLLMGMEPHDWDITTSARPDDIKGVFRNYRIIETGIAHGTVTVLIGGKALEITSYRIDGKYSDNRRPDSIEFTGSLSEDLKRRDFTIGAMAYSPESGIIDLFGGREDIENGVIRCVGEAEDRFDEDALRILRALRFASTLGFRLEEKTSRAVFQKCKLLQNISVERVNLELTKLLCGSGAEEVLLKYRDVLAIPIPELSAMFGFDQKNRHHCFDVWTHTVKTVGFVRNEPVLRWAALFHDIGKPSSFSLDEKGEGHFYGHAAAGCEIAEEIMRRLRFDKRSRERILLLIKYHDTAIGTDERLVKRWLGQFGEEFVRQLLTLKRADNLAQSEAYRERQGKIDDIEAVVDRIIEENSCISLRDIKVNGNDMLSLGYSGKEVGRALEKLLDGVIDGSVLNERDALLKHIRETGL